MKYYSANIKFENYLKFENLCLLDFEYTLSWWRWASPEVTQSKICAIKSFYFTYEVDILIEVLLDI